jgi:CHAT domain-containing protein
MVLRPDAPAPNVIDIGDAAAIDPAVAGWRRDVVAGVADPARPVAAAERALRRAGRAVRERVWDPVAAHLGGTAQAFVVPDGALNLLPLAALPADEAAYLVDTGPTLHYLSAERDVVAPAHAPRGDARGLLAIGGPAYGPAPAAPAAAAGTASRAPACGGFDDLLFADLPASRREVEDVGALWHRLREGGGGAARVLTGAAASEAAFRRLGPGHRILHLATHGFFLGNACAAGPAGTRSIGRLNRPGTRPATTPAAAPAPVTLPRNPLLWSGLALAGANRRAASRAAADDGILTAEEVAALDLDGVEWAVLSACDTGVGAVTVGEGVFGLRRAFRIAGARTVVMSLWEVEDRAARAWMRPLYQGRLQDRLSTAEAVRHASRRVLGERRAQGLNTHPFYWAGFVAAGDWR